MSEDQFTKLFKYMQESRTQMDARFSRVDQRFDDVLNALDAVNGRLDTLETEYVAIKLDLNRHKGWIDQLASTTSTKLVPEA